MIMPWKIVERKMGRAGSFKQRLARQQLWNKKYGEDNWAVGYLIDGEFVLQEEAIESIYFRSYELHFQNHPEDISELISLAKVLRNPHAEVTTGVDLQVPAIMEYLRRYDLKLQGNEVVDIGSWKGQSSHAISVRLSPLQIKCSENYKLTLEKFWQNEKCLAVWSD